MKAFERARADIHAGRLWKARDRLEGHLGTHPHSQDALGLLGEVCLRMGDLPAAGRYWYLTEDRGGAAGEQARKAFEERCGGSARQIVDVLPLEPPLDGYPPPVRERLERLAEEARRDLTLWWSPKLGPRPPLEPGGRVGDVACTLGVAVVILLTVGVWILGWVFLATTIF